MSQRSLHPNEELVLTVFSRGEASDAEGFSALFSESPVYQFGNFEPGLTREAIRASTAAFFTQIQCVYHDIKTLRAYEDRVLIEMDVHYWRLDGSHIALPCADIFRVKDGLISELRIFMDVNPLVDPTGQVKSTVSVYAMARGKTGQHPGWMRWFFAEHPEGKARVVNGHPPRWSLTGPKWPIVVA